MLGPKIYNRPFLFPARPNNWAVFFSLPIEPNAAPPSQIPPTRAFGSQIRQKKLPAGQTALQVRPAGKLRVSLVVLGTHATLGPTSSPRFLGCQGSKRLKSEKTIRQTKVCTILRNVKIHINALFITKC